jgi:hypothetical protein
MTTVIYSLIILIFAAGGGFDRELRPVEVPACEVVDGVRVENENCGIRACLRQGRIRAAEIAKDNPGKGFGLICKNDNGELAREGAEVSPGHGNMNWQKRD